MEQVNGPGTFYNERLIIARTALAKLKKNITVFGWLRLLAIAVAAFGALPLFNEGSRLWWLPVIAGAVLFIIFMNYHTRMKQREVEWQTRLIVIGEELQALAGDCSHQPSGRRFMDPEHPFSYDLDLFGKGSVYQLLCRTVTYKGGETLADLLRDPYVVDVSEIDVKQSILQELSSQPEFLLEYRVAGRMKPENAGDFDKMMDWLKQPDLFITKKMLAGLIWIIPILTVATLGLSFYVGEWHPALGLAVALNWLMLLIYRSRITKAFYFSEKTAGFIAKYEGLLHITGQASFTQENLQQSALLARKAISGVRILRKLMHRIENRQNPFIGPLMNSLFLYDLRNAWALEQWRRKEGTILYQYLEESGSFDTKVSLAVYAFHHPENVYPEIAEMENPVIEGQAVKHPLMQAEIAVGNDFSLGRTEQLYLLTGANMTGKSTFIRTVGVNLVLACIGLPLPVKRFRAPLCRLYTSMRVTDSVQDDVSYFKAELNRMKDMLQTVRSPGQPCVVLLDEPLRGTNSGDKQAGTEAIIQKLLREGAIGIIATHDISLGRLETELTGKLRNYHFESLVERDELLFDFKLKEGCSSSHNATLLMRQMGII